jgi:bifunctional DNA-binding transcriptional regulator/antitoxin component of YhaV-PrlF toxin-antitoxin module
MTFKDRLFFMTTTLTGKNQITIPAALSLQYRLKPGTRIEWLPGVEPDEIVCRVLPDPATIAVELRGSGRKYLQPGKHPITALLEERTLDDAQREASL